MTLSPHSRPLGRATGFSLIELVSVMAIIAILAAIAIPSYSAYTRRAHRADVQQFMLDMALRQGEIKADARAYATDEEMEELMPTPPAIAGYYTVTSAVTTEPDGFTITATAIGNQVEDGDLTLTNTGVKTPSDKW